MPGQVPGIHEFQRYSWLNRGWPGKPGHDEMIDRQACGLLAGGNRDLWLGPPLALALQPFGHDEGKLERLVGVEPRVAMGVIAVRQIGLGNGLGAAHAFSDVLPGHLDMDAAGMGAFAAMNVAERLYLRQDEVHAPRLVAASGLDGVAVHGVAGPHHDPSLPRYGADQLRKMLGDLVGSEAADERKTSRLVLRVEHVDELEQLVGTEARPDLQSHRVLDAAQILDMSFVELPRAVAHPKHVP